MNDDYLVTDLAQNKGTGDFGKTQIVSHNYGPVLHPRVEKKTEEPRTNPH